MLVIGLSHCATPEPTVVAGQPTPPPTAQLKIEIEPKGATVFVDGGHIGSTPGTFWLSAGRHTVRIEMDGYDPMERIVILAAGDEATIDGELDPLGGDTDPAPTSTGTPTPLPAPTLTPVAAAATPTPTSTPVPTAATPTPTFTPIPPTPTPAPPTPSVSVREGQVTILTYPYADFVAQEWNEAFGMHYGVLDRVAFEASNPIPNDVTYRTLIVENEYLALTFLPDLGGRLYEVIYKPTGNRETYRNPVLKPTVWGPPEQGWWLAAGGFEWCLPVEEHGYEWGVPWKLAANQDLQSASVTLRDTAPDAADRVHAIIEVRLEGGEAAFRIQHRLENPTSSAMDVKYWTNAMLAPGEQNAPSAGLRFVLPAQVTEVTVHSRGDEFLPNYNERMSWPLFGDVDLSRLGNWSRWLGFFENPAVGPFMAVYDEIHDEGMVRVFPADTAQGAKVFAFGWLDPIPSHGWTDDGSGYVEVHGGPAPTFDDSVTLPAGEHLQWSETWYPVAGLGGLRYANGTAALNLFSDGDSARLAVAVTRSWSGDVVLLLDDKERWRQSVSLVPGQPFREAVSLGNNAPQTVRLALRLEAPDGTVTAEYSAQFNLE
jgi:hypothetical protein